MNSFRQFAIDLLIPRFTQLRRPPGRASEGQYNVVRSILAPIHCNLAIIVR